MGWGQEEREHVLYGDGTPRRGGATGGRDTREMRGSHDDPLIRGGRNSKGEHVTRGHVPRRG